MSENLGLEVMPGIPFTQSLGWRSNMHKQIQFPDPKEPTAPWGTRLRDNWGFSRSHSCTGSIAVLPTECVLGFLSTAALWGSYIQMGESVGLATFSQCQTEWKEFGYQVQANQKSSTALGRCPPWVIRGRLGVPSATGRAGPCQADQPQASPNSTTALPIHYFLTRLPGLVPNIVS